MQAQAASHGWTLLAASGQDYTPNVKFSGPGCPDMGCRVCRLCRQADAALSALLLVNFKAAGCLCWVQWDFYADG